MEQFNNTGSPFVSNNCDLSHCFRARGTFAISFLLSLLGLCLIVIIGSVYGWNAQKQYAKAVRDALEQPGEEVEFLLKEKKRLEELGLGISWAKVDAILEARQPPPQYGEVMRLDEEAFRRREIREIVRQELARR